MNLLSFAARAPGRTCRNSKPPAPSRPRSATRRCATASAGSGATWSRSPAAGSGPSAFHGGGEAEDAEVAGRGLLVAGGDGPPLLEPAPEPLDQAAVVVDVVGAGDRRLVAPGRDRGPRALAPDEIAEGVRAVAAVAHDPQRHAREPVEEPRRQRQLVRLPRGQREGYRAAPPVRDDARLRAEAPARPPQRLPPVALGAGPPFLGAPAALGCALMLVPSRNAMPSSTPRPCAVSSSRRHAPSSAQRMNSWAARHQGPSSAGIARHVAPFRCRQTIASSVRRRSRGRRLALRPRRLDQRLQRRPLLVREHQPPDPALPLQCVIGGNEPQALTGPRLGTPNSIREHARRVGMPGDRDLPGRHHRGRPRRPGGLGERRRLRSCRPGRRAIPTGPMPLTKDRGHVETNRPAARRGGDLRGNRRARRAAGRPDRREGFRRPQGVDRHRPDGPERRQADRSAAPTTRRPAGPRTRPPRALRECR